MEQHSRRLTKSETAEMIPKHPRNVTKSRAHHFAAVLSKLHMRMAPAQDDLRTLLICCAKRSRRVQVEILSKASDRLRRQVEQTELP